MAALRKQADVALGNVIGSNIFNIGSVLGLTSIIDTVEIHDKFILSRDVIWMLVFAIILLPLVLLQKRNKLEIKEGFLLIFLYGIFVIIVFK